MLFEIRVHPSISHIFVLLWSFTEIEPLLCSALAFPIREKNLSDSRAASEDERKKNIQTRYLEELSVGRSPVASWCFWSFTRSDLDAARAGRLVGGRQRRAGIVIPSTSQDYCILLDTTGLWELREEWRDCKVWEWRVETCKYQNSVIEKSKWLFSYHLDIG